MLRIILIRPGTTDYDTQGRIQGTLDIPLNEQGNLETSRLAEQLRGEGIELIYAPVSEPAHQTGEALAAALEVKLKRLDQMQNLDHGLWQGMLIDDVRRKHPKVYRQWQEQPESVCPPDGEMLSQAEERVRAAVVRLLKRHRDGVIGVVLSEPLASLLRAFVKREGLGDLWKAAAEHAWWEVMEITLEQVLAPSN
jgi:broad specificity phosphatase PhoE